MNTTTTQPSVARDAGRINGNIVISTPGTGRGEHGECSAYEAVLRVTNHATRHLGVDVGMRNARQTQRKFAGTVNRLVKLLAREMTGFTFEIRFLDARESAIACVKSNGGARNEHKLLAVQVTVYRDKRISYDFAISHSSGGYVTVFVERTVWPHRGCGWLDGKTTVTQTRASKVMSSHVKRILATPVSVCAESQKVEPIA